MLLLSGTILSIFVGEVMSFWVHIVMKPWKGKKSTLSNYITCRMDEPRKDIINGETANH